MAKESKMKKIIVDITFIILAIAVVFVSASVQESANQTIVNVATLTLQNSPLGTLEEEETKSYAKATVASLGNAISITTTKASVFLHLNSDIYSLSAYYITYTLTVKYISVPGGSSHSVGDVAATLMIATPDSVSIPLDVVGSWAFDFELTTPAKAVSSDQATTATIVVTVSSHSS